MEGDGVLKFLEEEQQAWRVVVFYGYWKKRHETTSLECVGVL